MQHRVTCMVGAVLSLLGVAAIWLQRGCQTLFLKGPAESVQSFRQIPSCPGPAQRPCRTSYPVPIYCLMLRLINEVEASNGTLFMVYFLECIILHV
ncbi:hypothetical protein B0H65DRAFT_252495 [Neurospora tetraspora]|uniref:Uncharacterized protein n=1 Tax=Neurospora tetraspora TaxID=94610 RepID=A0AAE0JAR4_9PEZI|nr:hypothetical protein B0H65DRAFT_252495 [Neurospora tetraspora]